jgi:D-alanyl-D-alanine carboxypeptidase
MSSRLDAVFYKFASRRRDVHHAVIAVTRGDSSFQWTGACGEVEPGGPVMGADSPYFIASISKLYLATVVMLLAERRRLTLDDRISDHLPAHLIAGLHRWRGVDRTSEITVRHLLSHTSGLADYYEGAPRRGPSLRVQLTTVGDADVIAEEALRIVREDLAPRFPPQPLDAPRQRAFYADTNFLLLGLIVQSVTGDALGRVYEDLLFRPLDLRHTYHYGRTQPLSPLPSGPATIWFKDRPLTLDRAMRSFLEDGIVSTANDTLQSLDALVHGRVFSNRATLDVMQGRWNRIFFPFEYALGTMRFRLPRIMTLRYLPALVGHAGSSGSWLFHCPELDLLLAGTLDQAASPSLPFKLLSKVLWLIQGAMGR